MKFCVLVCGSLQLEHTDGLKQLKRAKALDVGVLRRRFAF